MFKFNWENENKRNSALRWNHGNPENQGYDLIAVVYAEGGETRKKKNKETGKFDKIEIPVKWFVQHRITGRTINHSKPYDTREDAKKKVESDLTEYLKMMSDIVNYFKVDK